MKENPRLRIGDTVFWKGFPPETPAQLATVTGIEKDADGFTHNGEDVASLKWKRVKDATVVFDNGHWDHGYNVRRLTKQRLQKRMHTLQNDLAHARDWAETWRDCALGDPRENDPESSASDGWAVPPPTLDELWSTPARPSRRILKED